ncbi:FG-GAP-like repeat-containing protein [Spirosoma fluviale]|uniref:Por secretion system C-terminal sorting domain-containing protein n=1 Tax=Spirosoma fluviale TaxID=1597977 RepID=A0A286G961_9BACT|nr:FG-GAP-like repeat-containing protein [Spirosoma fluviale]SOD92093.1 Por secretion system C-terminal sorting domain-containing protein [Spirosoma fluviale]
MKKLFTLCFLVIPFLTQAQSGGKIAFRYDQSPTVSVNNRPLLNPWAGGLNTTQYSTIRLNNDTRDDLAVYDRTTGKVSTFIAVDNPVGSGTVWQYAPEYELAFPAVMYSWMLLVDYDFDGRKDIFTNSSKGISVWHNESEGGVVSFKLAVDPLRTLGFSGFQIPLYVNASDLPAITDYDDDGDIDIITFDADGNIIAYQQNMSVERTGKKGGLDFARAGNQCWGHFQKEFCNDFRFGINCDDGSGSGGRLAAPSATGRVGLGSPSGARPLHSGNTLTVIDTDGDGHKDLLFGFVSCENIARLRNSGPNSVSANFTSYDSLFPARNPILFPAFPSTFFEDVDGDGQKDLLASPNVNFNDSYLYDFRASGWFYKNTGTTQKPDFQLVQKDFLQSDMLDLGERTAPALADLDGDGDLDLLVGYGGVGVGSGYRGGIWQFENKGTTQSPAFVLVTTDYLGAQSLGLTNVMPTFADVDGNGSMDLIITATGKQAVEIRALINTAPKGAAAQYSLAGATRWPTPDLMFPLDLLTVTDVDRDNKPDLLISRYNVGTILYYRNAGTATAPVFQLQNQTFGGITTDDYIYARARSLVVADLNGDQKNELIAAADNGSVKVYQFPETPTQAFTLIDSLVGIGLPGKGLIAAAADLDGDQLPDLLLGGTGGGLRYLKNTSQKVVVTGVPEEPTSPWVFPNPTNRYITVRPHYDGRVELVSLTGQTVVPVQPVKAGAESLLDLGNLADGTYLIRLQSDNRPVQIQKVVVWK